MPNTPVTLPMRYSKPAIRAVLMPECMVFSFYRRNGCSVSATRPNLPSRFHGNSCSALVCVCPAALSPKTALPCFEQPFSWLTLFQKEDRFQRGVKGARNAERQVQRRGVLSLFNGDDGLASHLHLVGQLLLGHFIMLKP